MAAVAFVPGVAVVGGGVRGDRFDDVGLIRVNTITGVVGVDFSSFSGSLFSDGVIDGLLDAVNFGSLDLIDDSCDNGVEDG